MNHHHPARALGDAPARSFKALSFAGLLLAGLLTPLCTLAQEVATGTVKGRVFNAASGAYVNNAKVTVDGTAAQTYTNETGEYELTDVPAGTVRMRVSYTGQTTLEKEVTVETHVAATADFTFNADDQNADAKAIMLDPFVVESSRFKNAQDLAINEEKVSTNIKSVVALDSLGYVSDGSVGEFVRFLPGLAISYGESSGANSGSNPENATTVSVRGFDAFETAVLIDGMPVASGSPAGLTRAVQLDGLSVNNANRLEVIKVATPDMAQDASGGTINLITRGAFELPKATYDLTFALNGNSNWRVNPFDKSPGPDESSHKTRPSVRFSTTIPISEKLGVSMSVSRDSKYSNTRRSRMRDWSYRRRTLTYSGTTRAVANSIGQVGLDNPVIDRFEIYESEWLENRDSGNFRVDWRPIPDLELRANVQFSTMENTGISRRTQWRYNSAVADWGPDYVTGFQQLSTMTGVSNSYSAGSMSVDARDREGYTMQGYITLKYRRGPLSIDAKVSNSDSYNNLPDFENGHFSTVDVSIPVGRMDITGIDKGTIGEIRLWDRNGSPLNYGHLSTWSAFTTTGTQVRSSQGDSRDERDLYQVNVSYDVKFLPFPTTLKAGWSRDQQFQQKGGLGSSYRMAYIGPAVSNSELESAYASEPFLGYAQRQYWADPTKIYALYAANPQYFNPDYINTTDNTNLVVNNYNSMIPGIKGVKTTKDARYAMATVQLFRNRLSIIGGARQTTDSINGFNVYNNPNGIYVQNADGSRYRDQFYTQGVRFNGQTQSGVTGGVSTARDVVLTDAALRARMQAANVKYLPTALALAPNGVANGSNSNNLIIAQQTRYTRYLDTERTQPATPQLQLAYDISDSLKARLSWNRSTRLPDTEGDQGILVGGASFQITDLDPDLSGNYPDTPGAQGSIRISNVGNLPEINNSYNINLGWYPKGGKYSISYYYKVSDKTWLSNTIYNDDPMYDPLVESMGLATDQYENYSIVTVSVLGAKRVRKGFEVEAAQNLGVFGKWGNGWDVYATYSPRPTVISGGAGSTNGVAWLGWVPELPGRAQWTAGISYSARRFSVRATGTWFESKLSYNGNAITVDTQTATGVLVQTYNLNKIPPSVKVQADYILSEKVSLFFTADRVFEATTYDQIADSLSGLQPDWAKWRLVSDGGIRLNLGANVRF
jgi:iron complex outermembrane recepter protein